MNELPLPIDSEKVRLFFSSEGFTPGEMILNANGTWEKVETLQKWFEIQAEFWKNNQITQEEYKD